MIEKYKNFNKDEVNELFLEKKYNVVYINYEKENGIEVVMNEQNAINNLKNNELNDFYKLYLFNDNKMITVYKFDEKNLKYTQISKDDFEGEVIVREVYLDNIKGIGNKKRLKVKIGNKVIKENEEIIEKFQIMQYIGFSDNTGGDKNDE